LNPLDSLRLIENEPNGLLADFDSTPTVPSTSNADLIGYRESSDVASIRERLDTSNSSSAFAVIS
jgi:hypothetical protein